MDEGPKIEENELEELSIKEAKKDIKRTEKQNKKRHTRGCTKNKRDIHKRG